MEGKKKDACSIQHKKYKEHQKAWLFSYLKRQEKLFS